MVRGSPAPPYSFRCSLGRVSGTLGEAPATGRAIWNASSACLASCESAALGRSLHDNLAPLSGPPSFSFDVRLAAFAPCQGIGLALPPLMNVKIHDLMAKNVISAQPHHTVDHVRKLMQDHGINAVPIAGPEGEPVGIATTGDLAASDIKGGSPISQHMSRPVHQVPAYNDPSVAARIMRKHKCHHVVVTHEGRIEGIISSFDLLALVEDHRYVAKNAPQNRS